MAIHITTAQLHINSIWHQSCMQACQIHLRLPIHIAAIDAMHVLGDFNTMNPDY